MYHFQEFAESDFNFAQIAPFSAAGGGTDGQHWVKYTKDGVYILCQVHGLIFVHSLAMIHKLSSAKPTVINPKTKTVYLGLVSQERGRGITAGCLEAAIQTENSSYGWSEQTSLQGSSTALPSLSHVGW